MIQPSIQSYSCEDNFTECISFQLACISYITSAQVTHKNSEHKVELVSTTAHVLTRIRPWKEVFSTKVVVLL